MKKISSLCMMTILMLTALTCFTAGAATSNPSPASTGYQIVALPLMGTYSSTSITPAKFKVPFGYRVVAASVSARAATGTNPTLTVDVKSGSTSVFSSPVSVTAGSITDAVLATSPILKDESTVSVILAAGGTAPKWSDITLVLGLKRQ